MQSTSSYQHFMQSTYFQQLIDILQSKCLCLIHIEQYIHQKPQSLYLPTNSQHSLSLPTNSQHPYVYTSIAKIPISIHQ